MWNALTWLKTGLADLRRVWTLTLAHGVLFSGLGWILINWGWSIDVHYALAFTSGFFIAVPLLAVCLYDISRCIERGEEIVVLSRPWRLTKENPWTLSLFVVLLALLFSMREWVTAIMVGFTLRADVVVHGSFGYLETIAADPNHLPVVIGFFAVSAVFGLIAFILSAVSLPLIVDRQVDIVTAIVSSVRTVTHTPLPMMVWAASIATLIEIDNLTCFIGLIVIFPLMGHATWHA